jgi:hypothetical protein
MKGCQMNRKTPSDKMINSFVEHFTKAEVEFGVVNKPFHLPLLNRFFKIKHEDMKLSHSLFPVFNRDGNNSETIVFPGWFYDPPVSLLRFHTPYEECSGFIRFTESNFHSFSLMPQGLII